MPTESDLETFAYFETPERTERLQLITHLLNNAEDVPYLRAPVGAGKTRFAAHLVEKIEDDYVVVWLNAGIVQDIQDALIGELGLESREGSESADLVAAAGDKLLLVVVDDADALDLAAIGQLFELHDAGARLLFLGNGGLSQLQGDWDLQFVDLPPFSEEQSVAFLETAGRVHEGALTSQMAVGLHRAAGGMPGHLIDALSALPVRASSVIPDKPEQSGGLSLWMLLLGGLAVLLLVLLVVFQDSINRLFEPADMVADSATPQGERAVQVIERPDPAPLLQPESKPVPEPELPVVQVEMTPSVPESEATTESESAAEPEPETGPVRQAESDGETEKAVELPGQAVDAPSEPVKAEEPDPVLDAVIDAAIAAAEQAPQASPSVPQHDQPSADIGGAPEAEPQPSATAVAEVAEVSPAPAVETDGGAAGDVEPEAPVATERQTQQGGDAWLKSRDPQRYTLQLVGARDRAAIAKFTKKHQVSGPYAIYSRQLNGEPWYSLVAGDYADRDEAVAARARLAAPLHQAGVWPRTFESIHEQLGL